MVRGCWGGRSFVGGLVAGRRPRLRTITARGHIEVDAEVVRAVLESRRRADRGFLLAMSAPVAGEPAPDRWSAIVDTGPPPRWRIEQGTSVFANDGANVTFLNNGEAFTRAADRHDDPPGPISDIVRTAGLAVAYDLGEPIETTHLGRRCVAVVGTFKESAEPMRASPSPQFGDRCRLILDIDAGLIVKWQSWFGGAQLAAMALDLLEIDQPLPDDAFHLEIPPGVRVRTAEELLEGRQSTRRRRDSAPAFEPLGDYVPHGAPPADPAAASRRRTGPRQLRKRPHTRRRAGTNRDGNPSRESAPPTMNGPPIPPLTSDGWLEPKSSQPLPSPPSLTPVPDPMTSTGTPESLPTTPDSTADSRSTALSNSRQQSPRPIPVCRGGRGQPSIKESAVVDVIPACWVTTRGHECHTPSTCCCHAVLQEAPSADPGASWRSDLRTSTDRLVVPIRLGARYSARTPQPSRSPARLAAVPERGARSLGSGR